MQKSASSRESVTIDRELMLALCLTKQSINAMHKLRDPGTKVLFIVLNKINTSANIQLGLITAKCNLEC